MPQLTTNWYFERRPAGDPPGQADRDDDSAPGLTCVPPALLQRHGARVLNPSTAAAAPSRTPGGQPSTPRSTVYRARTLLIPADLLRNPAVVRAINEALALVGMRIVLPVLNKRPVRSKGPAAEALRRLPRPVVLIPAVPQDGHPARPVVIDAWTALQTLRAAAVPEREKPATGQEAVLTEEVVRRIALEHLLIGASIPGPSTEGNGITGSPSTEGNGVTGPSSTDSYVYNGGDTRAPVMLSLCPPARDEKRTSRRPVVAILDTGVRAHPWLDVARKAPNGYLTKTGGFVAVDHNMQAAIYEQSKTAADQGDQPRHPIRHPWDTPVTANPLIGELDTETGHGTFIAGIVRQVAPDARVLAVRIMHSDGVVYEGDLVCALGLIADRVAAAEAGAMDRMVDVVSLSLGYFEESSADVTYSSGLWQAIKLLLDMGVTVVAAAGNYSTRRRFYPAAFTLQPPRPAPLISVGALNPNGSKALFSDGGAWVWAWAAGAAVVSTFPVDINASRCPDIRARAYPDNKMPPGISLPADREALDPDNYHGGLAVWSGTSFSAPLVAAHIAAGLAGDNSLSEPGAVAAAARTTAALKKIHYLE